MFQPLRLTTHANNASNLKFHLIETPDDLCHEQDCPWDSIMIKYFKLKSIPLSVKHKYNVNAQEFIPASRREAMLTEPISKIQSPLTTPNLRLSGLFGIPGLAGFRTNPHPYDNNFTVLYSTSEPTDRSKPSRPSSKAPSEAATGSGTDYAPSNESPEKLLLELAEEQQKLGALYEIEAAAAKDLQAWHLATSTFNEALLEHAPSVLEHAKRRLAETAIQHLTTHESGVLEQSRRIVQEVSRIRRSLPVDAHNVECRVMEARLDNISNALSLVERELIARATAVAGAGVTTNNQAPDPYHLDFTSLEEQVRLMQLQDAELRRQTEELASMLLC